MGRENWRLIMIFSATGATLSAIGLIIVIVLFVITNNEQQMYSVVLDAGSSSTKLNLFGWKDQAFRTNADVDLVANLKAEPGISDYVGKPFGAYKDISPKLRSLTEHIPTNLRRKTPIYLAATAGMRLKLLEDPLGSMELFEVLRRNLLKSGLHVETPNERIRMLSGAEEGLYGWVTVNSMLGLISMNKQADPTATVGSLDLGGASTQISFVPGANPPSEEAGIDYYPLNLFGKQYEVYSHSFLCYGKNEFENRINAVVIQKASPGTTINHPCLLEGYSVPNQNPDTIFQSPCVTGPYAEKVFQTKLTKPALLGNFSFIGTGDTKTCNDIISEQFNMKVCTTGQCSFNDVFQPEVRGQFRAYSGFSYVMAYLFKEKVTGFSVSEVTQAVATFCTRKWSDVQKEKGSAFAAKYCFDGYYLLALLKNFGFNSDDKFRRITFEANIKGKPISWALGFMLDQSGQLPSEVPQIYIPVALFATLAAVFAIILILSVVGLALFCSHQSKKDYP